MVQVFNISSRKKKRNFVSGLSLTTQLILLNVVLYFVSFLFLGIYGEKFFVENLALTPSLVLAGKSLWTFLTSMFMHGSFFHIFANMFSLFFLGGFVEKLIGRKRFFWVYMIAGLTGGLFYVLSTVFLGGASIPAVGASGAIFGLLGLLAVIVPFSRIYLIIGPLILIVVEVLSAAFLPTGIASAVSMIINILIILMIFALFSFNTSFRKFAIPLELPMWVLPIVAIVPLSIIGLFVNLPIGNSAHFGGLIIGLIYGFYLRKKFPNKTKFLSRKFR